MLDGEFTLTLNGVTSRLVETSTPNVFRLESDPLWLVELNSGASLAFESHGQWWKVTTPDGTVFEFGHTDDSLDHAPVYTGGGNPGNCSGYHPTLHRFISADTIIPDPANPQAHNRYTYVANNPTTFTDPSGHGWIRDIASGFGPVIVNVAVKTLNVVIKAPSWAQARIYKIAAAGSAAIDKIVETVHQIGTEAANLARQATLAIKDSIAEQNTAPQLSPGGGNRIALGLGDNLDEFAQAHGALTYRDFPGKSFTDDFLEYIGDPNNDVLFNLDGVSRGGPWGGSAARRRPFP
jgi:hypothetical protein